MKKTCKYLIVGLGNPGTKYQHTRHNVGFDAVDRLISNISAPKEKKRFSSKFTLVKIENTKLIIIKPQTYMNNSGVAVKKAMNFYRIKPENVVVIYDDMDIPLGKIRIRKKGSGGTHNGMKSIISFIRSYDFPRIRIGIGKPNKQGTIDFVLGKPNGEEKQEIQKAIEKTALSIEALISEGIDKAMQEYNK